MHVDNLGLYTGSNDQFTKVWMTILIEYLIFCQRMRHWNGVQSACTPVAEVQIGIFGSVPDLASCFNHHPFISAPRCPPAWSSCIGFQEQNLGGPQKTANDTGEKIDWLVDIGSCLMALKCLWVSFQQSHVFLCMFNLCFCICAFLTWSASMLLQMTFVTVGALNGWLGRGL